MGMFGGLFGGSQSSSSSASSSVQKNITEANHATLDRASQGTLANSGNDANIKLEMLDGGAVAGGLTIGALAVEKNTELSSQLVQGSYEMGMEAMDLGKMAQNSATTAGADVLNLARNAIQTGTENLADKLMVGLPVLAGVVFVGFVLLKKVK